MPTLCLKNEPVLQLKETAEGVFDVQKIINKELLPLILVNNCTTEEFTKWLDKRRIPDNRDGISTVIEQFGKKWMKNINYLSLSDQYWIKNREEKWKQVNYFTNRYDNDIGNMFFSPWKVGKPTVKPSPDLTCGGLLKKRWKQDDKRVSFLIKAGSVIAHQEPLSEVLVSVLCEKLNKIKCVKYELCVEGVVMCSKCENFVTENTDFVPASHIYYSKKRPEKASVMEHLIDMCELYEIPGAKEYIMWTIFVDHAVGNDDRNLGNMGFLRDINTMKFIGPAPLFDSGNAYWSAMSNKNVKKARCFEQDEKKVVNALKKEADLSVFSDKTYEAMVFKYPELADTHKEKLITTIETHNKRLIDGDKSLDVER